MNRNRHKRPHTNRNPSRVFAHKRAARIVDDTIVFHGARLEVDVHNRYRSRLFRKHDIAVADERTVRLLEDGVNCSLDRHLIRLRFCKRAKGSEPPFSAFVGELPRKTLRRFPVMLEQDRRGRLVGLTIFRPQPDASGDVHKPASLVGESARAKKRGSAP